MFTPFSPAHQLTLLLGGGFCIWVLLLGRTHEAQARRLLVTSLLLSYPLSLAATWDKYRAIDIEVWLPFQLCDLVAFIGAAALLTRRHKLGEITYFWALGGSLQGLLTPNLEASFPEPLFFTFFFHHFCLILVALYLPLVQGWRPSRFGWLRAWIWLNTYVCVAIVLNFLLGTNYGFLAAPPTGPSVLDFFGPHPWYLISLQPMALLIFYVLQGILRRRQDSA